MKENYVYPIKIHKDEDGALLITFPNFPGNMTQADTEEGAIRAAQEVLALCITSNEDAGIENPPPLEESRIPLNEGEKLIYVHLWMPYFRYTQKVVYVKKTLTIPKWLDDLAKKQNLNFSGVLVKGLKEALGIIDPQ